ncbi:hypothetical protein SBOR_7210 [Sclerotinia borealis F-4128]|uniref:C2H2-type domain-containing protein n=1 Tax=Sclerotinia borealis (strain F-4128) TaxID=1432307 RepID=W9C6L7_SCLBF|nr:hypothetical protein SBOR_7210 [Sclerotinia borealis F-4128]
MRGGGPEVKINVMKMLAMDQSLHGVNSWSLSKMFEDGEIKDPEEYSLSKVKIADAIEAYQEVAKVDGRKFVIYSTTAMGTPWPQVHVAAWLNNCESTWGETRGGSWDFDQIRRQTSFIESLKLGKQAFPALKLRTTAQFNRPKDLTVGLVYDRALSFRGTFCETDDHDPHIKFNSLGHGTVEFSIHSDNISFLYEGVGPNLIQASFRKSSRSARSDQLELEVLNQPFEYYGPQQGKLIPGVGCVRNQANEDGYQENTKFIGIPVFPAELPFDNYTPSPIALSHRTSSNLSAQHFSHCSEAPSSPTFHTASLIKQPISTEKQTVESMEETEKRGRTWKWYIVAGVIAMAVIIAGVVGGIVASKKNKATIMDKVSGGVTSSNSSSPTSSVSSNSPTSTNTASLLGSTIAPFQRNIAAVSYASKNVNNSRIYYQDNQGNILESHNSASTQTWTTSQIVTAKNGSSFAAAVTMPENTFEITVLYSDSDNLLHDIIYNVTSDSWDEGTLSSENFIISENSRVSVMYWQCLLCSNTTIIAFQDLNNQVQVGNLTNSGWTLTQMNVGAIDNTGLALQPFYRLNEAHQINLYYQQTNSNMAISAWEYTTSNWSINAATYYSLTFGVPIAASASYTNVKSTGDVKTGFETWGETLTLSHLGLKINTYMGAHNDWEVMGVHPSAMSNSTQNPKVFKSIAATAIGAAFIVVENDGKADVIESYQVEDDAVNWSSAGTVDIGDPPLIGFWHQILLICASITSFAPDFHRCLFNFDTTRPFRHLAYTMDVSHSQSLEHHTFDDEFWLGLVDWDAANALDIGIEAMHSAPGDKQPTYPTHSLLQHKYHGVIYPITTCATCSSPLDVSELSLYIQDPNVFCSGSKAPNHLPLSCILECGLRFKTIKNLKEHCIATGHEAFQYSDPDCLGGRHCAYHTRRFHPGNYSGYSDKIFACHQCGDGFMNTGQLDQHGRNSGHSAYLCHYPDCVTTTGRIDDLIRHQSCHKSKVPRHPCLHCRTYRGNNGFKRKDHLRQHIRNYHKIDMEFHTGDIQLSPFRCRQTGCDDYHVAQKQHLRSLDDLTQHMRNEHNASAFICPKQSCDRVGLNGFDTKKLLDVHIKNDHPSPFQCTHPGCARVGSKGWLRQRDQIKHMSQKHGISV